jgi:hypothetical protein
VTYKTINHHSRYKKDGSDDQALNHFPNTKINLKTGK